MRVFAVQDGLQPFPTPESGRFSPGIIKPCVFCPSASSRVVIGPLLAVVVEVGRQLPAHRPNRPGPRRRGTAFPAATPDLGQVKGGGGRLPRPRLPAPSGGPTPTPGARKVRGKNPRWRRWVTDPPGKTSVLPHHHRINQGELAESPVPSSAMGEAGGGQTPGPG